MLEIEFQLIWKYTSISIIFAKVMKRFPNGLPLLLDLIEYYLDHIVLAYDLFRYCIFVSAYFYIILDLILLKDSILNGVMPEVETHHRVNVVTDPSTKVFIAQHPFVVGLISFQY